MTQIAIEEQISSIRSTKEQAMKSREAAHAFLVRAGIVKSEVLVKAGKATSNKK